jgi:hypothetical protein
LADERHPVFPIIPCPDRATETIGALRTAAGTPIVNAATLREANCG